jgi:protein-L-isoaspartate(D-aspartate) O-methyltransferase
VIVCGKPVAHIMSPVSHALARQLANMGIRDERVLRVIEQVPRQLFVPPSLRREAEADKPLPIGCGQTISQPFIVAYMTEALQLAGSERVLEVGSGSGYQTALLALLAREVFSIEIVPELAARAAEVLLGPMRSTNVRLRVGDGRLGWPEEAPFDRIIVTAAPASVPEALAGQLAPGGRMVIPVGADPELQSLRLFQRGDDGASATVDLLPVRFVPLTGGP